MMAIYNLTDYPNYAALDAAFKAKLIGVLQQNELGPAGSPYALVWAGTEKSGWSFGAVQYDVAALPYALNLFREILLNAKETQSKGSASHLISSHHATSSTH